MRIILAIFFCSYVTILDSNTRASDEKVLLQLTHLHTAENCSGGVVLVNGSATAFYLTTGRQPFLQGSPVVSADVKHSTQRPKLKTQIQGGRTLYVVATQPKSTLSGLSFLLLNDTALEMGYSRPHGNSREDLNGTIVIGSYVSFRECKVGSDDDIRWLNTEKRVRNALNLRENDSTSIWLSVDDSLSTLSFSSDRVAGRKIRNFAITNDSNLGTNFDFSTEVQECFGEKDRMLLSSASYRASSVDQCVTWDIKWSPPDEDRSGLYFERDVGLGGLTLISIERQGSVLGLPLGRTMRLRVNYSNRMSTIYTKLYGPEEWETVGESTITGN